MAVLRNSDSVTGIRFVPLHPPNSKSIWQRIRLFHPNELATAVVLRAAPAVSSATRRMMLVIPAATFPSSQRESVS
jgi:hypothetical protein